MKHLLLIFFSLLSLEAQALDPKASIICRNATLQFSVDFYQAGHPMAGLNGYFGIADMGPANAVHLQIQANYRKITMKGSGGLIDPIYYVLTLNDDVFENKGETPAVLMETIRDLPFDDKVVKHELGCKKKI